MSLSRFFYPSSYAAKEAIYSVPSAESFGARVEFREMHIPERVCQTENAALMALATVAADAPRQPVGPVRMGRTVKRCAEERHSRIHHTQLVGSGVISQKNPPFVHEVCDVQLGREYSKSIDKVVSVFNASIRGCAQIIGKCTFEILCGDSDCDAAEYLQKKVVAILNLDSFEREKYRGIGTLLMQVAIEYGIAHGAEGRVSLHSTGTALGFYRRLGMVNGYNDVVFDRKIEEEVEQAVRDHREPKDLLDGDVMPMYLPRDAISSWRRFIQEQPVFAPPSSSV